MTNAETTQVAVTEEMRSAWAAQFANAAKANLLDLRIAQLIKMLASNQVPADQIEAAREMLTAAKAYQS